MHVGFSMRIEHVVRQGESVARLACTYGFFPETIWNHPDNAELKALRGHMNILLPGDVVVIPEREAKAVTAATGKRHVFRRRGIPAVLRLQLRHFGEPRARQPYRLTIGDRVCEGTTDGDGFLQEFVDPDATLVQLVVGPDDFTATLRIGHMDPITVPSGIRKRLRNLGFSSEAGDDASLARAVAAFQQANGLAAAGTVDDATRAKLGEVHDRKGEGEA